MNTNDLLSTEMDTPRRVVLTFTTAAAAEQFLATSKTITTKSGASDEPRNVDGMTRMQKIAGFGPLAASSAATKHCEYCDGTGDVHGIDGEWRGECTACDAASSAATVSDAASVALNSHERLWVENRASIIDAINKAGFELSSNKDRCWLAKRIVDTHQGSTFSDAASVALTDEQHEALSHLVSRGSTFPDHNGPSGSVSRVDYAHLRTAAKVLRALLATSQATTTAGAQDERVAFADFRDRCEHYHGFKMEDDESQCTCKGNDHIGSWCEEGDCPIRSRAASSATAPLTSDSDAVRDVLTERQRQMSVEGWTPEHDDKHSNGDLAQAAGCYAFHACGVYAGMYPVLWPWQQNWWKPTTPRRDLVKAGALILAEIERIDRAQSTNGEQS